tara:strand:+ start:23022 stop:24707 length:1686 start_codon:yes stop_codon:yes gene_type:complete
MLNPSAEREVNNNYRLSTEKARQWWNNQAFESRKNIVIESDAVINDDQEVEDQMVADVADKDYDDLPDITQQEIDSKIDDEEDIEQIFDLEGESYLQCSKCDDLFTSNEDYDLHKDIDHGEEPEDFEESEETYQLAMNPDLTREALREANSLLTETEERELYSGYDKNGEIQSSVMPYNLPPVATGKYNDNPNEFFYSNKIFRNGSSTERNSALGEALEDGISWEYIHSAWNQYFEQAGADNNHVDWLDFAQSKGINGGDAENKWNDENYTSYGFHSESKANEFQVMCPKCHNTYDTFAKGGKCEYCGADNREFYGMESKAIEGDWDHLTAEDKVGLDRDIETLKKAFYRELENEDDLHESTRILGELERLREIKRTRFGSSESKASEDDYEERPEWDWLTNKSPAPEVDYDQVEYEDDGVSDISVPNTEPKGEDKNEFLDDVDYTGEAVDYVYPTKATESTKSYITESEPFEEEYEEFEDSDDEMIEETISIRKLTGYSDNSIAQELHINYGVSHEEALEKVYSVEVSTNDRVAQTFFGKMYKECNESEKDELRMYSGSD